MMAGIRVRDVQAPPLQARTFQALRESFRPVALKSGSLQARGELFGFGLVDPNTSSFFRKYTQ